ncbi:hypothetical protein N869_02750, partial [Cellulomonas bogoriensis 69B4 = DSM 16987]
RAGAATRLLADLVPLTAVAPGEDGSGTRDGSGPWGEVVVVLEGAARRTDGTDDAHASGITVVRAEGSGDDCIVEQVHAREGRDVVVVTSDRELRRRVQDHGAQVRGARWLLDLAAAPR